MAGLKPPESDEIPGGGATHAGIDSRPPTHGAGPGGGGQFVSTGLGRRSADAARARLARIDARPRARRPLVARRNVAAAGRRGRGGTGGIARRDQRTPAVAVLRPLRVDDRAALPAGAAEG